MSEFSKALFSHLSLYKLQIISKLIARNSHLAMKVAITAQSDITSIILTRHKIENIQGILLSLTQNYNNVKQEEFCSCSGSLTLTERWYQRFYDKRQSLKACIHKPKSIYVELNAR